MICSSNRRGPIEISQAGLLTMPYGSAGLFDPRFQITLGPAELHVRYLNRCPHIRHHTKRLVRCSIIKAAAYIYHIKRGS